jgi:hypothetical protein
MKTAIAQSVLLMALVTLPVSGMPALADHRLPVSQIDNGQIQAAISIPPPAGQIQAASFIPPPAGQTIIQITDGELQGSLPTPVVKHDDIDWPTCMIKPQAYYPSPNSCTHECVHTFPGSATVSPNPKGTTMCRGHVLDVPAAIGKEAVSTSGIMEPAATGTPIAHQLPVTEIGDGQVQAGPATKTYPGLSVSFTADGQPQAPLATPAPARRVSLIYLAFLFLFLFPFSLLSRA